MKSSVINCGAVAESGGGQNRTYLSGLLPSSLPGHPVLLRLAQPQGLGTSSPCSILKSEQAWESTAGWIACLLLNTLVLLGPQGDVPFTLVCLPAWTMTHPHHFAFYTLAAGPKRSEMCCFLSLKGLVHITSSDWSSALQSPLPPPSSQAHPSQVG